MTSRDERPIAILSAPGSRGDVNPIVAIGSALKGFGFDVVISLAEAYAQAAEDAGLMVEPVVSREEFDSILADPLVWKPLSGIERILRDAAGKFVDAHLDVINRHHRPGRTVLVAHPLDFASRIYRDHEAKTPMVSVLLSPAVVRDFADPPRLTASWFEPRRPAWLMRAAYRLADRFIADPHLCPPINQARKRLGLSPVKRILDRWWLSPELILGLYPTWFGEPIPRGTAEIVMCGFPSSRQPAGSVDKRDNATKQASKKLASSTTMTSPSAANDHANGAIFFTPGTAHRHAESFFRNAIEACARIGQKGILATSHAEQIPQNLPSHMQAVGYVPLDPFLRTCSAMVHHGGIGTTAMGLATGCPQLVCPMAFDQFHNADRVDALGAGALFHGDAWKYSPRSVNAMADALRTLVKSPQVRSRCDDYSGRCEDDCGAYVAAIEIVALMASRR